MIHISVEATETKIAYQQMYTGAAENKFTSTKEQQMYQNPTNMNLLQGKHEFEPLQNLMCKKKKKAMWRTNITEELIPEKMMEPRNHHEQQESNGK